MARRKKTVLLKTDLEEILALVETQLATKTSQCDVIVANLEDHKRQYYFGRRTALMELAELIKTERAARLD